jgi:prepilin-type N-terminal cleavage/methylation domain-containing protein
MNYHFAMRDRSGRTTRLPHPLGERRIPARTRGFSLLEMIIVVCISLIAAAIASMMMRPVMRGARADSAYQITLSQLRNARNLAITNRKTYMVVFAAPRTITTTRLDAGVPTTLITSVTLPLDITFNNLVGIPNTNATTPDNMGTGAKAIDFDINVGGGGSGTIYFWPDGTTKDINGNLNSGIVYTARNGDLLSSRAVTLFGATGRSRGWRLVSTTIANQYKWVQQ